MTLTARTSALNLRALYLRFDRERRAAVNRRMRRRNPMTVAGVTQQLHADGQAWITELGQPRGLTIEDVVELIGVVDRDTTNNIVALLAVGALSPVDAIRAGIGAGVAVGVMVGHDHAAARAEQAAAAGAELAP